MKAIIYLNHVSMLLFFCVSLFLSLGGHKCYSLERNGRRCGSSVVSTNRNRHQTQVDSSDNRYGSVDEELMSHHNDRYGMHSRPPGQKKDNFTRVDLWPQSHGYGLGANSSWSAIKSRPRVPNQNQISEPAIEPTTTEATDDIERFLVGRRRKRGALWMNPNLYYNRDIGNSLAGSSIGDEGDEEELDDNPLSYGHNSDMRSSSAISRQIVQERTLGSGNHNFAGHGNLGHGLSSINNINHNNRTPLFYMPRTNPLLKVGLM